MSLYYVDRSNDEEIIDIVRSILSEGGFIVETYNESILVELMKRRRTPLKINKSLRDTEKDYVDWLNVYEI